MAEPDRLPLDDLIPNETNSKGHAVDEIRASIRRFGFVTPMVIDARTGKLGEGHGRTEALLAERASGQPAPAGITTDSDGRWLVPVYRGWASANDAEATAFLVASNRLVEVGGWDDQALLQALETARQTPTGLEGLGYTEPDISALLARIEAESRPILAGDPDEVPERVEPVSKRGDVWLLGPHRVACCDSIEALPAMKQRSVGLIATDPPYFRMVEAEWDDQWGPDVETFLKWIAALLPEFDRVLIDRGTVGLFCSPSMSAGIELEMRRVFAVFNHIVWRKPEPGRFGAADKESMRSFFPASERLILAEKCRNPDGDLFRFRNHVNHAVARDVYADVRQMLVDARDRAGLTDKQVDKALGTNGMAGHYFGGSQWCLPTEPAWKQIVALAGDIPMPTWAELRQEFDSRHREFDSRHREFDWEFFTDVWTFARPIHGERLGHPTQKPVALMEHIVGTMSRPGDVVFDPFLGSGSTLIAAHQLGRTCYGMEIDPHYVDVICARYESLTGDKPVRESTGEPVSFLGTD